jgi:hypothetical protein
MGHLSFCHLQMSMQEQKLDPTTPLSQKATLLQHKSELIQSIILRNVLASNCDPPMRVACEYAKAK